jgi:transposase
MFPQLPAAVRVFLCTQPTDMRKSFDGLVGMVREYLGQDPLSGHLFLFLNRRRDRVKILFWERDGLVIWYKRLEAGTFQQFDPATCAGRGSGEAGIELTTTELALLLTGVYSGPQKMDHSGHVHLLRLCRVQPPRTSPR